MEGEALGMWGSIELCGVRKEGLSFLKGQSEERGSKVYLKKAKKTTVLRKGVAESTFGRLQFWCFLDPELGSG